MVPFVLERVVGKELCLDAVESGSACATWCMFSVVRGADRREANHVWDLRIGLADSKVVFGGYLGAWRGLPHADLLLRFLFFSVRHGWLGDFLTPGRGIDWLFAVLLVS